MSDQPSRVTFRDIAREAGVSIGSVTHAFRGNRHVSPAKREHILAIARQMGYRPNPMVTALMSEVRRNRVAKEQPIIAMIDFFKGEDRLRHTSRSLFWEGARQRADALGHRLDLFEPVVEGIDNLRLSKIFHARNISGIILPPLPTEPHLPERFPWEKFCVVTAGFQSEAPAFHAVLADHFAGVNLALQELIKRGHRKIGLYVSDDVDHRVRHSWSSAYYRWAIHSGQPPRQCCQLYRQKVKQERFLAWMQRKQPEAVLVDFACEPWLLQTAAQMERPIAIANLIHHLGHAHTAGINQSYESIGQAAVDLLTAHLYRNEIGVPEFAKKVLIPPIWMDGPSVMNR